MEIAIVRMKSASTNIAHTQFTSAIDGRVMRLKLLQISFGLFSVFVFFFFFFLIGFISVSMCAECLRITFQPQIDELIKFK